MKSYYHKKELSYCFSADHKLFRHLTETQLEMINQKKNSVSHKRGTILYHEGNRINGFYCIESGIIKIYKTGIDGKEQIIRFAKKGDLIGFRSVMNNETACTSAEVIEDSFSFYIPGQVLIDLVRSNGDFSLELMQITCSELGEANAYITDIAQKTVRERLAEVLLLLHKEFGIDDSQVLCIYLTREELANIVGTATESVIRLLSEFKQDSLISINGRKIKLNDIEKLKKIANYF